MNWKPLYWLLGKIHLWKDAIIDAFSKHIKTCIKATSDYFEIKYYFSV